MSSPESVTEVNEQDEERSGQTLIKHFYQMKTKEGLCNSRPKLGMLTTPRVEISNSSETIEKRKINGDVTQPKVKLYMSKKRLSTVAKTSSVLQRTIS